MLELGKSILIITKEKIIAAKVKSDDVKELKTYDWSYNTFINVLENIKDQYGSDIQILLDDDFVYTTHVYVPAGISNIRSVVKEKAQALIPENLDNTAWDFKESPEFADENQKSNKLIQILAVDKKLSDYLGAALTKLEIKVEIIESISSALVRIIEMKDIEPIFIIYQQSATTIITGIGDLVVSVKTYKSSPEIKEISNYLKYVSEQYGLAPKRIYLAGKIDGLEPEDLAKLGLEAITKELNPMLGLLKKRDDKGKDEEVLNIKPIIDSNLPETVPSEVPVENDFDQLSQGFVETKSETKTSNKLIIAFVLIGLFAGLVALLAQRVVNNKPVISNKTVVKPIESEKKAKKTLKIADYSITILNGSGEEGAAGKAEELLDKNGFKVVDLDNAENYDYEQTEIQVKKGVPQEFYNQLYKTLTKDYEVIQGDLLDTSNATQVVVIIGRE